MRTTTTKRTAIIALLVMLFCIGFCLGAVTVGHAEALPDEAVTQVITEAAVEPAPVPGEPLTWAYLATIAGAAAGTLLIVQFFKVPLDKVWKIPTRVFVYFVALILMLLGTTFTVGLTVDTLILTAVNAFVAALTAYGSYELTFAKAGR